MTFRISRLDVTSVGAQGSSRHVDGLAARHFRVRSFGQIPLWLVAVWHSRVVTSNVSGQASGRRRPWQGGNLGSQLISDSVSGDGATRRWELLPQNAGRGEDHAVRLPCMLVKLRSCVRLAEGNCKGRARSPENG